MKLQATPIAALIQEPKKCSAEDQAGYPACDQEAWYRTIDAPHFYYCESHAHSNRFHAFRYLERVETEERAREIAELSNKTPQELAQLLIEEVRRSTIVKEELQRSEEVSKNLVNKVHRNNLLSFSSNVHGMRVWAVEGQKPPNALDADCPNLRTVSVPVSKNKIVSVGYGYVVKVEKDSVTTMSDEGLLKYSGIKPEEKIVPDLHVWPGLYIGNTNSSRFELIFGTEGPSAHELDIAIVMRHFSTSWFYRENSGRRE